MRKKPLWGKYEVGDDGVVYSSGFPLVAIDGTGVNLGRRRVKVAYLVARAFVANSECRPYVRHKNGDVRDNRACNLEWSEEEEVRKRGPKPAVRWCRAWTVDGDPVGEWRNVGEASAALGVKRDAIQRACDGRQKSAGGYLWRWIS